MISRACRGRLALLCGLLVAACASPAPAAGDVFARGRLLAIGSGYVAFTSGAVVKLAPATVIPKGLSLGAGLRVAIDPASGAIHAIELEPAPLPGDVEVDELPRAYLIVNPAATASQPGTVTGGSGSAAVTIDVRVPPTTQPTDDVYLSTDRSGYSPAEVPMTRLDAERFTTTLRLPAGSVLHYEYTRGSFATLERTRVGGVVTLRALEVTSGAHAEDTVARWADDT